MRCASISATAQATACSRMRSASSVRRSAVKFLRVVQPDDSALGIEDDRGGDNRTKQRAAPGFIETRDARPAELARRSLETGRAESAHIEKL